MKRDLLGAVLCGGRSLRMGMDKAALEVRPGISQLDYLLSLLEPVCIERAVCLGSESMPERAVPPGTRQLRDPHGFAGPMAGVIAALQAAAGRPVLALACDLPFLNRAVLERLIGERQLGDLATAYVASDGLPDPTCCIYEAACLPLLESLAASGKVSLRRFLSEAPVCLVTPEDGEALSGVNDPGELERARFRLGEA